MQRYKKYLKINRISVKYPFSPKFILVKYPFSPKFILVKYPFSPKFSVC